ncbi:SDR family NAD(P)-dependent oxidoreductase [Sphingopyxis sp. BSN-002]|uniref:SDR family NAD(P)-dependent oxidoreductase n=1 Tax=Sphingopyxis sp. BSN-002 TaxID=2911495 RepID=UPI001EDA969B|nr:SDR family NAD(P)-dependent oxidoreductase [Sphingopyxis sp. BSN-002]UKK84078.1 SDR family NAD(P)-dependent oxidoreductase [Sphingopyxis sp. BSN-002]
MKIDGVAAIVTGGGSGLGAATAKLLAARGAKVAILDRDPVAGERVATETGALFAECDVTCEASVKTALDAAEARHGTARILVNCAGISDLIKTVDDSRMPHSLDAFRRIIDINLVGTFNTLSQFAARLCAADPIGEERGVIVNTSSIAAFDGIAGQAAYSASKNAIAGMSLPIARDLAPHRIRIVAIAPGTFLSPMVEALPQQYRDALAAAVPHPSRLGRLEEFAEFVETIIASPMINGTCIRLDGAARLQ